MDSVTGEEFIIKRNAHTGSYIYYLKFNWNENEILEEKYYYVVLLNYLSLNSRALIEKDDLLDLDIK